MEGNELHGQFAIIISYTLLLTFSTSKLNSFINLPMNMMLLSHYVVQCALTLKIKYVARY